MNRISAVDVESSGKRVGADSRLESLMRLFRALGMIEKLPPYCVSTYMLLHSKEVKR